MNLMQTRRTFGQENYYIQVEVEDKTKKNIKLFSIGTNLTLDKGPKVSWNSESEHDPRKESSRSIFG